MTPEQIHQLGLSEVARITKEFEKVRQRGRLQGRPPRTSSTTCAPSPKFAAEEPRAARAATSTAIKTDGRGQGPAIFLAGAQDAARDPALSGLPREVRGRRQLRQRARRTARGPGTFYFNAYDLPSRFTWEETTLFLHEGEPGHHFQISLAQENKALPSFMRFGGNTAYVEGWALYSETLGYRHGLLQRPVPALRHAQRRDAARDAAGGRHRHPRQGLDPRSGDRTTCSTTRANRQTDATAEVERYIAIPSQAVAYKIGSLTIQRLRDEAKAALGPEVRHPRIPRPGARSAARCRWRSSKQKIDRWIAAKK